MTWKRSATMRVGEMLANQGAVGGGEVHAHHAHLLLALEIAQVRLQGRFAAAGYHVVDGVVFEIAEGSREALAAAEEMLVDAEYARANRVGALGHHAT